MSSITGYNSKYININNKRRINFDPYEYFNNEGTSRALEANISSDDNLSSYDNLFETSSPSSVSYIDTNRKKSKKQKDAELGDDASLDTDKKQGFETVNTTFIEKCSTDQHVFFRRCAPLPLEWWERDDDCLQAKRDHMDRLDHYGISRERLVYLTTLHDDDVVLEKNMFPYNTPTGIEHYTLWSVEDMSHEEIEAFVDKWLENRLPQVRRWQYDDNLGNNIHNIIILF